MSWLKKIFPRKTDQSVDQEPKVPHKQMQQYVDQINKQFPVDALWDGYKIRMFKRSNLVIGGSQDWTYYHNIDVIFKKVIFFNLPDWWKDTWINHKEDLFRLSNREEFKKHHPDFDIQNRHVFAFDMCIDCKGGLKNFTYFVVAKNVFFERFDDSAGDGMVHYDDPLGEVGYECLANRVIR